MVSAINSAVSGLAAAGKRLEVAAENVANQHSTQTVRDGERTNVPYQPQEAVQTSLDTGGVKADVRPTTDEPVKVYSPDSPEANEEGFISLPGVNLEEQIIQTKIASYDYKANLKSIQAQDNLFKSLLDITA